MNFARAWAWSSPPRDLKLAVLAIATMWRGLTHADNLPPSVDAERSAEMVLIPSGEFIMGRDGKLHIDDEAAEAAPRHRVTVDAFEIDRTEVTQQAYSACIQARRCPRPTDKWSPKTHGTHPAIVSWHGAVVYCEWRGARLPSEAEWEKAARGVDGRTYPWGNRFPSKSKEHCKLGNFVGCSHTPGEDEPGPVGIHPAGASPYGVLDMAGNAQEWVHDWYKSGYGQPGSASNPQGPPKGRWRVIRDPTGTNADDNFPFALAVYNRALGDPEKNSAGFRCARSLK